MAEINFEKELEAVAERAISADSRSSDNTKEIAGLKVVNDGQQKAIAKIEDKLAGDKDRLESLEETIRQLTQRVNNLQDINEAQHRSIEGLTDRLNGKGLVQVDPYEKVVAQVRGVSEQLTGGEGQLSYAQVRGSIQNTQYLGRILYGAIGLFGVGGVMTAGLALFGVDKVPPEVQNLQIRVAEIKADIDLLQNKFDQDLRDRLRGEKK